MIEITIVCSPAPRQVFEQTLRLAEGATLRQAVAASELATRHPELAVAQLVPGIWGRTAQWDDRLHDGDRIELCRPLRVDPKVARRERFERQGTRGTGLFSRRRKGGKAGY